MTIPPSEPIEECEYYSLSEGIHELVFHSATESSIAQCFKHLYFIFEQASLKQPLLLLSDIRESGVLPTNELWRQSRRLLAQFPHHPTVYNAVVYMPSPLFRMFTAIMEQLAQLFGAKIAFFEGTEREKAIAWLIEQRQAGGK
jgi:hypothetical protein